MARRKRRYRPYEARLIQLLRRRFEAANWKVDDHLKVGKLPLEIDLVAYDPSRDAPAPLPKLFEYFKQHNVIEVKTEEDPLKLEDLLKLQGYAWLYLAKKKVFFEELQIFSGTERRKKLFVAAIDRISQKPLLDTIIDLYESEVLELMALLDVKPESMPKYIEALGKEKIIAALNKTDMLAALNKEDMLAALSDEELLAAFKKKEHLLKALLASLGSEQPPSNPKSDKHN